MSFFDWPTQSIARSVSRIATLLLVCGLVLFLLGRYEGRVSLEAANLERETKQLLATIRAGRSLRDSLGTLEDSLRVADSLLTAKEADAVAALDALAAVDRTEVEALEDTPVDDLLRPLRLDALRITAAVPRDVYVTDEAGVRFLAGRMLRLAQVERRLDTLELVARTRADRIRTLVLSVATITEDRDSLQVQLDLAAPLLERYLQQSECKILWLVPCPSRTASFLLGVGVTVVPVVVLLATQE